MLHEKFLTKKLSKMSNLYSNQPWYLQNHLSTSVHVAEGCKLSALVPLNALVKIKVKCYSILCRKKTPSDQHLHRYGWIHKIYRLQNFQKLEAYLILPLLMEVLIICPDSFLASFDFSFSAASLSAFFFSYSICLTFSSCARMNILTKFIRVATTIDGCKNKKTKKISMMILMSNNEFLWIIIAIFSCILIASRNLRKGFTKCIFIKRKFHFDFSIRFL